MSWIQKLYETYEACSGKEFPGSEPLMPIAHTTQKAHIEVVIDGKGNFRRAALVQKDECLTVLPATESSAGRTSGEAPHPLCDKIQYCAGDYEAFGGTKKAFFESYLKQIKEWSESPHSHPKVQAVHAYISKRSLVADLSKQKILVVSDGCLVVNEKSGGGKNRKGNEDQTPEIFKLLTPTPDQGDAFVRWIIEDPQNPCTKTWEDDSLFEAWQQFDAGRQQKSGFCMVGGEYGILAEQHPAKLRHGADKAKLISSNDTSGFTFRGRFIDADQAAGVSFKVTQKAHNALRWLINRQAYNRNGDQAFVCWAVQGQSTPDPFADSMKLFTDIGVDQEASENIESSALGDVGQSFAFRLNRVITGYKANLEDSTNIVVMGLDSATPGRMSIIFYRELKGSEFLDRIRNWHSTFAWHQNFGKEMKFVGAPSPRDIAEAAYGRRVDEKLKKATVERLIPCIVDGERLPKDLVFSCTRRAYNRVGMEHWEWEKVLGIACALFKGYHNQRSYQMELEEDRRTRDYLYGRLLAVAERIESMALYLSGETRDTMAARLMQRFADRPFSTWRTIELSLTPYKARLRSKERMIGFLIKMEHLLDELISSFPSDNENESFTSDRALSGEFLLGYHCQRQKLHEKKAPETEPDASENVESSNN